MHQDIGLSFHFLTNFRNEEILYVMNLTCRGYCIRIYVVSAVFSRFYWLGGFILLNILGEYQTMGAQEYTGSSKRIFHVFTSLCPNAR